MGNRTAAGKQIASMVSFSLFANHITHMKEKHQLMASDFREFDK